jgi:hypothetical protein
MLCPSENRKLDRFDLLRLIVRKTPAELHQSGFLGCRCERMEVFPLVSSPSLPGFLETFSPIRR